MKTMLYRYYKVALKALPNFHQTLDDLCDYCRDDQDSISLKVLTIISGLVRPVFNPSFILTLKMDSESQKGRGADTDKLN